MISKLVEYLYILAVSITYVIIGAIHIDLIAIGVFLIFVLFFVRYYFAKTKYDEYLNGDADEFPSIGELLSNLKDDDCLTWYWFIVLLCTAVLIVPPLLYLTTLF
ncbi:MAG: hypothetical protein KAG61_11685 [Bacteriovoracaceae bacterium]|nr:hypothetical protein [Bacteriovoracaceae bacterium]